MGLEVEILENANRDFRLANFQAKPGFLRYVGQHLIEIVWSPDYGVRCDFQTAETCAAPAVDLSRPWSLNLKAQNCGAAWNRRVNEQIIELIKTVLSMTVQSRATLSSMWLQCFPSMSTSWDTKHSSPSLAHEFASRHYSIWNIRASRQDFDCVCIVL